MAGCRWSIETSFQTSKSIDLDEHQLRRWTSWHRHTTLVMLAYAILAVIAAREQQLQPDGRQGLIPLTVKEIRRLFAKLVINTQPFSSWVAVDLGCLEHEDRLDHHGASLGAAAQLGQNLPGLQHGDGPFTFAADAGVVAVDLLLPLR